MFPLIFARFLEIFQPFRNELDRLLMDLLDIRRLVRWIGQPILIPMMDSF